MRKLVLLALLLAPAAALAQAISLEQAPQLIRSGRFEAAIAAMDARLQAAAGPERVAALYWRGQAQGALGARGRAAEDLQAALREAEQARADATVLSAITGALGLQLLQAGALEEARTQLERAQALARGMPSLEAAAGCDVADLLLREGRAAEAAQAYRGALEHAQRAAAPALVARATMGLLREQPASPEALALARRAAAATLETADSHDKAYRLIALATLAARPGQGEGARGEARDWLVRARDIGTSIGDLRAVSHAQGQLGRLYEESGQAGEALALTRLAVVAAQQGGATEALYRWQWQSARLLAQLGQEDEAFAAFRRAFASFAAIRQDLIVELRASRKSYRETVGPLFLQYADLQLQRSRSLGARPEAQRHLLEARDAIESLKAVELEDYFQDQCVANQQSRQKELGQVAPRTAVLYPVILPGRLELLLTLPSGMRQIVVEVTGEQLTSAAQEMRLRLEKRSTRQYLPQAQRLYDWLVRPIEPLLAAESVDTLVLVADGPLRAIPMAALHDGSRFLVERFALASAPGLRLIEPRALSRHASRVLLSGLTESVQEFAPLPHVASEVRNISEVMPATVLADKEFLTRRFEDELRGTPYSVVHVASHAQFDSDPKKSFLLTFDSKLDMDGLERVMRRSRFRDEPVELLALSACSTAAGDERAALGLAGIAVKAGARSALATLWYINDEASSTLVSEFYRRLADPAFSKARALQEAQRTLLRDERFRHPGFWSPFLLIGNWL